MTAGNTDWIGRVLARWVEFVLRHPKTIIVLCLGLAALGLTHASRNLGINTDTADMISSSLPWRRHFIDYRESFPGRDRNIVAVVDADDATVAETFAARLADGLRAQPELFDGVYLAGAGAFFERNGLLYLSVDALERLADRLAAAQPLLGLVQQRFNGAGVVDVARRAATEGAGSASADLDTLYAELARTFEAASEGVPRALRWRRVIAGEDAQGARRLVLVQPALDFARLQPAGAAIERIRELAAEIGAGLDARASVRLTGTVAMEHEELLSVSRGAGMAGLIALGLVTVVLLWALKSVRLLAISIVTLLAGLALTAAFAAVAVGHLNLLSVAFAVLYIGLGVDFILHINLRVRELLTEGAGVAQAVVESMRGVGASLVICAVTTAAGFYSFIPTPFEGVSELGLISGTGMFISLFVSITLLPALLATVGLSRGESRSGTRRALQSASVLTARPMVVVAASGLLAVAAFASIPRLDFDSNPIHLRDPASESVTVLEELAAASEAPVFNLVALADDAATATRWAEELEALPEVGDVATVDSLVPDDQDEKLLLLEDIALIMGPGFAELTRAPPDLPGLKQAVQRLGAALARLPEPSAEARRLAGAADRLLETLRALPGERAEEVLVMLDRSLTRRLPGELERLESGLDAVAFDRDDLPGELLARWRTDGRELIEIVPARNINDNGAAEDFVAAVRGVVPSATGMPVVHQEASATVVSAFKQALMYAFVLVTVILVAFLRRASDVLLVIVPILAAAGVTAGAAVWLGLPLNFANIIALPLLVGVGVDNGIHMVHRMRTEPPQDGEPFSTSTSRAILTSGLTTIASFGNLAFSTHVGMASMGQLLTLGMAMTLAATLLLLPALIKLGALR